MAKKKIGPKVEVKTDNGLHEYRVLCPILWIGERIEKDTILKMTDEQAKGMKDGLLERVKNGPVQESEKDLDQDKEPAPPVEGSPIDI